MSGILLTGRKYLVKYRKEVIKMTLDTKDVRARIQGIKSEEIKRFTPVDELPIPGSKIDGTNYYYGKFRRAELSRVQRTRDDGIHNQYDFYVTHAVDDNGVHISELYFCTPHQKSNRPSRKMFTKFFAQARKYDDIDKYVEDMMKSEDWIKEDVSNEGREEWLMDLYNGSNMTFEALLKVFGFSQQKFCDSYGIPKRTVENWIYIRQPHLYLMILFEESLGMISCE